MTLDVGNFNLKLSDKLKIEGNTIFYQPNTTIDEISTLIETHKMFIYGTDKNESLTVEIEKEVNV